MAEAATALGGHLAQAGIRLVYGGGGVGLMGVIARAVLAAGGEVIGVIPQNLARRELMLEGLTEMRVVGSMHDRKRTMFELSEGFVSLPGGIGTLDETVEVITWRQMSIHDHPIILVDIAGYWQAFVAFMQQAHQEGFAYAHDRQLYKLVPSVEDVIPALSQAHEPTVPASPDLT